MRLDTTGPRLCPSPFSRNIPSTCRGHPRHSPQATDCSTRGKGFCTRQNKHKENIGNIICRSQMQERGRRGRSPGGSGGVSIVARACFARSGWRGSEALESIRKTALVLVPSTSRTLEYKAQAALPWPFLFSTIHFYWKDGQFGSFVIHTIPTPHLARCFSSSTTTTSNHGRRQASPAHR